MRNALQNTRVRNVHGVKVLWKSLLCCENSPYSYAKYEVQTSYDGQRAFNVEGVIRARGRRDKNCVLALSRSDVRRGRSDGAAHRAQQITIRAPYGVLKRGARRQVHAMPAEGATILNGPSCGLHLLHRRSLPLHRHDEEYAVRTRSAMRLFAQFLRGQRLPPTKKKVVFFFFSLAQVLDVANTPFTQG